MHHLPIGTHLGQFEVDKVLEYYDFPRLFTCRSITGQRYFAVSTYDDERETRWLYLPLSTTRCNAIFSGAMALREAFEHPEGGYLMSVILADGESKISYELPELIPDDDLPSRNYQVQVEAIKEEEHLPAVQTAVATRRETFDYHIFLGRNANVEVPARKLGGIFTSTQELLDALGQATLGDPTVRGPIPTEVLQQTRVNVAHTFPGSFGVQFRAAQFNDLLAQSTISSALQELSNLLRAKDSEDLLSNKLHLLKGRVASKYRRLLKELSDINSGLLLDWGSVHQERGGQYTMSPDEVKAAYAIVDRIDVAMAQETTITGKLIGFNARTQRYEILSGDDGRTYAGKVSDDAEFEVTNPAINQFYEADLKMLVETQSSSGDELIRWILVRLGLPRSK